MDGCAIHIPVESGELTALRRTARLLAMWPPGCIQCVGAGVMRFAAAGVRMKASSSSLGCSRAARGGAPAHVAPPRRGTSRRSYCRDKPVRSTSSAAAISHKFLAVEREADRGESSNRCHETPAAAFGRGVVGTTNPLQTDHASHERYHSRSKAAPSAVVSVVNGRHATELTNLTTSGSGCTL
jgi:hypothetical protein